MVEAIRTYKLSDAARPDGVQCDDDGLVWGGVELLERATDDHGRGAWRVRSARAVDDEFAKRHGLAIDAESRSRGLAAVAQALNEGGLAKAQIAALQLRLPSLNEICAALGKTWVEDEHPRWPALSPDSVGGQFMSAGADQPSSQQAPPPKVTHLPRRADIPQPGAVFHSAVEAAHAVYAKLLPLSVKQNEEYTFFYYRDNKTGLIGYTDPVAEGRDGGADEHILPTTGGQRLFNATLIGMGHTHASYVDIRGMPTDRAEDDVTEADHFSPYDMTFMRANVNNFTFYTVGTPSGQVLQYVPGQGVSRLPDH